MLLMLQQEWHDKDVTIIPLLTCWRFVSFFRQQENFSSSNPRKIGKRKLFFNASLEREKKSFGRTSLSFVTIVSLVFYSKFRLFRHDSFLMNVRVGNLPTFGYTTCTHTIILIDTFLKLNIYNHLERFEICLLAQILDIFSLSSKNKWQFRTWPTFNSKVTSDYMYDEAHNFFLLFIFLTKNIPTFLLLILQTEMQIKKFRVRLLVNLRFIIYVNIFFSKTEIKCYVTINYTVSGKHFNYRVKQKLVPSKKKRPHILLNYSSNYNVPRHIK